MGLGYIGLPTAIITAQAGLDVIGVDINQKIVDTTNQGKLHIIEPMMETMLKDVISAKKFYARTTPVVSDAYLIVVPTPFNSNHQPHIIYRKGHTHHHTPPQGRRPIYHRVDVTSWHNRKDGKTYFQGKTRTGRKDLHRILP